MPLTLYCGCDQVGSLRMLTDQHGTIVKEILYDSFGRILKDTFSDLFIPIGFAGGLVDIDTGLIRFGYRDYCPEAGRFTALDPAKDRRGDGDLYDYCVDDPIGRVDKNGLASESSYKDLIKHYNKASDTRNVTIGKDKLIFNTAGFFLDLKNKNTKASEGIKIGIDKLDQVFDIKSDLYKKIWNNASDSFHENLDVHFGKNTYTNCSNPKHKK